jgi:hypothetical protein
MSTEIDNDPDERLQRELARLPRELAPPKGLEARVVAALRDKGSLAEAHPRPNPWRLGGSLAAGLALLLAGFWLGRQGGHRGHPPAIPVPSYLLIMREGTDFNREGWSEARLVAETGAWARRQLGIRHFVVGEKLDMGGWVVNPSQGAAAMSPMNVEDAPDGFFVIAASSDQEALGIARSCPFLHHGGRIEVRRIHPT